MSENARTEQIIAEVWADVLGVAEVGRDDDFFDLGGYSILAMKVLLRLRPLLDPDLQLVALFDHPTVAELAAFIESSNGHAHHP